MHAYMENCATDLRCFSHFILFNSKQNDDE